MGNFPDGKFKVWEISGNFWKFPGEYSPKFPTCHPYSDKASPEDMEQIYTAVFDLPPEWWHYKVARPANASIRMLPDVVQPMWYKAFEGIAQVLKQWRHMEAISGILHGLSEEQYANFLDEIQGVMMQIASCGNQF